jgi:hypothetical protein
MQRFLNKTESRRYEPVDGTHPSAVLDVHPDGRHIALQAPTSTYETGGVWDRQTGRLVWTPEDTQALCWLPGGAQLVALQGGHALDERLSRYGWPGRQRLRSCSIRYDGSWTLEVVASPRGDLVAFLWMEQHKGGVGLVRLGPDRDQQLEAAGYEREPNHLSRPVFSPDGRFLVLSCGDQTWWNDVGWAETPAPGGRRRMGIVMVQDLDAGTRRELPVEVDVPAGWLPPEDDPPPETHDLQPIGAARFESDSAFSVPLITGGRRRFSLPAAGEHEA